MRHVFRVFWEAIKAFWEELLLLALMNIVTVLLLFPVITFPPALAGLWHAANLAAKEKSIHWSDYFEGFRRYFLKAWALALLNILVILMVITNVRFYTPGVAPFDISLDVSRWIRGLFIAAGFLWVAAQMYPMAMLLEQEDQRLRVALRNTAVLFFTNPGFTIVLLILLVVIAVISTLLTIPWILITLAFFGVICNKAVLHLLEPHRERLREEEEVRLQTEEEGTQESDEDRDEDEEAKEGEEVDEEEGEEEE
jgi:hypothetical protein